MAASLEEMTKGRFHSLETALDLSGAFKDYCELHKVQPLSTDLESMDACSLNYWVSKVVQEVANDEGEGEFLLF